VEILLGTAAAFALMSAGLAALARRAYRKRKWMGTAGRSGGAALFLSLSALSGTLAASTQGYRGLTNEEVAMTVTTVPLPERAFAAHVQFPDGRDTTYTVAGDQLLVDAHILKWHYLANAIGLHTQYELDRLTGRYVDIEDERTRERTVHSLKSVKPVDLFELVQRYSILALLVDAEYGSATYVDVGRPARFEVRVSTTGLLVREVGM
jgi:hypothetical protein